MTHTEIALQNVARIVLYPSVTNDPRDSEMRMIQVWFRDGHCAEILCYSRGAERIIVEDRGGDR